MPTENCCVAAGEVRVIYFESTPDPIQSAYTVPAGKVFVLTAWTFVNEEGRSVTARLRRAQQRVAFSRVWDPARGHNHLTFPTGIVFGPEEVLEIETTIHGGAHYFYGYEHDQ